MTIDCRIKSFNKTVNRVINKPTNTSTQAQDADR